MMVGSPIDVYIVHILGQLQKDHQMVMRYCRAQKDSKIEQQLLPKYDVRYLYDVISEVTKSIEQHAPLVAEYFAMREEECCVCYERVADVALICSHKLCSVCHHRLDKCPLCRMSYIRKFECLSDDDDFSVHNDDDEEVHSREVSEDQWWAFYDQDTQGLIREVECPRGTDVAECARIINISFNYDVFKKVDGFIECDLDYLHDDASYLVFPMSDERRRILKDRYCYMAEFLIDKCRYHARMGHDIELQTLREFRGY